MQNFVMWLQIDNIFDVLHTVNDESLAWLKFYEFGKMPNFVHSKPDIV